MNRERYEKYRDEIQALQQRLNFESYWEIVSAKIIDVVDFNPGIDPPELSQTIEELFETEYAGFVRESLQQYNDVIEAVNSLYSDLGVDVNRDFKQIHAIEKTNYTYLGSYGEQALSFIQKTTREALTGGYRWQEFAEALKNAGSKVSFYSNTIARTQTKGYGRACKYEKAKIGAVEWFEYVGIIRETTRTFCLERVSQTFHIDVIRAEDNGPGQPKPVIQYCGGWNCHHEYEPDPFKDRVQAPAVQTPSPQSGDEFVPARTIKDAEDYARNKFGLQTVKYTGLKLEFANEINNTMTKLYERYPSDINTLEVVNKTTGGWDGTIAAYNGLEKRMVINLGYSNYQSLSEMNASIRNRYNEGYFAAKNYAGIIAHEYGHVLTYNGLNETQFFDLRQNLAGRIITDHTVYASASGIEYVAETFASYWQGDEITEQGKEMLKEILKIETEE